MVKKTNNQMQNKQPHEKQHEKREVATRAGTMIKKLPLAALCLLVSGCASHLPAQPLSSQSSNSGNTREATEPPFYVGEWRYASSVFENLERVGFCDAKDQKRSEKCRKKLNEFRHTRIVVEPNQLTMLLNGKKPDTVAVTFTEIAPYHVRLNPHNDNSFELKKYGRQICLVTPLKKRYTEVKSVRVCLERVN